MSAAKCGRLCTVGVPAGGVSGVSLYVRNARGLLRALFEPGGPGSLAGGTVGRVHRYDRPS